MNRNLYDTDITLFSPQGRLFQVEYAMEAVNQGSAAVGAVASDGVVLAAIKRSPSELASYQPKIFKVDEKMGVAISGLTADARSLTRWMRTECLNHRYVFGSTIQMGRLVRDVADKHQECTQISVRRPYGVGLLIAGYDSTGPHLHMTQPNGDFWEYTAMAMGSRSQTAKTYLEKHHETFASSTMDEVIDHCLHALQGCMEADKDITAENVTLAYVTKDSKFTIVDGDAVAPYIQRVMASRPAGGTSSGAAAAAAPAAEADVEEDMDGDVAM